MRTVSEALHRPELHRPELLRLSGITHDSVVDGPGLRLAVFTQGCTHNCPGCHNPQTHAPTGGYWFSVSDLLAEVKKNPLLDGVTLTGGEPFMQAEVLAIFAEAVKKLGLHIMVYTGFVWEELMQGRAWSMPLLAHTDVLVDGPFVKSLANGELVFKGSSNQRLIDVPRSLAENKPVLWSWS